MNTVFVFGVNVVFDADDDGIVNCDDGRYELEYFKWNFRLEEKRKIIIIKLLKLWLSKNIIILGIFEYRLIFDFYLLTCTHVMGRLLDKSNGAYNEETNIDRSIIAFNAVFTRETILLLKYEEDSCNLGCNEGPARLPCSSALDSPKMTKKSAL